MCLIINYLCTYYSRFFIMIDIYQPQLQSHFHQKQCDSKADQY